MTRRKQNYPKRLKSQETWSKNGGEGSPSEQSGEAASELEAGGDNSPVATDEEEEDEEEELTGNQDAPTNTSLPEPRHHQETSHQTEDNNAKSNYTESVENPSPKSQPESQQRVSPASTPNPTPSRTATPSPSPILNPLASLSSMTVPATAEEIRTDVIKEGARTTPAPSAKKTCVPKNHTPSPTGMASVMMPMPPLTRAVLPSPDKDKPRRTSPAPKNLSRHRGHSNFYEKMAAQALAAATSAAAAASSAAVVESADDQPLDLSRKSSRPRSVSEPDPPPVTRRDGKWGGQANKDRSGGDEGVTNGISSLQSLQKRFGGDFLMETPRRPSSIIPLQSTILPSKSILRPPPIPGNGLSHLSISAAAAAAAAAVSTSSNHQHQQPHHHHHHHHHHSSTTTKHKSTGSAKGDRIEKMMSIATSSNSTTTVRKPDKPLEISDVSRKTDSAKPGKSGSSGSVGSSSSVGNGSKEVDGESKYTIHRCSCQKSFATLYSLSAHLQETGHVPGSSKQQTLMDYPKLVRGQDMWLNQESEQTRRILRCMQCGESFKSLPMLTVHMMQTQHYSKIVSAEHGRRSHKCSAYCDRELDRECIFKCKVCQETYTDMEGLANHMIVSGHHKKQVLRSHNCTELALRHKHRKRFLSDEASGSTVASLLEYKRKYQGGSGGSNGYLPQIGGSSGTSAPSTTDGFVTCESCGKKIEMPWFVEHVRLCLRQKAEVIDALKFKLFGEDCGGSSKPAETCTSSESKRESPDSLEQPLPSTRDTALFKRLNSLSCSSPGKDSSADTVDKNGEDVESKEEKPGPMDTDVNENENENEDVSELPRKDNGEVNVKCEDDTCFTPSPKTPPKDKESCPTKKEDTKGSGSCPPDESNERKTTDNSESSEQTKDESGPEVATGKVEEIQTGKDSSISPRIPSPMTDEENTSERSPSPPSDPSQSEDSKPPSPSITPAITPALTPVVTPTTTPAITPVSTPVVTPTVTPAPSSPHSKPGTPSPSQEFSQFVKREHDPVEEETRNPKKIKLEDTEHKDQGKPEEPRIILNKIKLEIPDSDSSKKTTTPSPVSVTSPGLSQDRRTEVKSKNCGLQDPSLDIIDPNSGEEPAKESGSSALKAMESFIQRSFSSKFDSRRNAMSVGFGSISGTPPIPPLLNMGRVMPRSSASPSTPTSSAASSMSYLSQFSKFFSPIHQPSSSKYLDIGMDNPLPSYDKNVLSSLSAKSAELLEKTKNPIRDMTSTKPITTNGLPAKATKVAMNKPKPAATTTRAMEDEQENEDEREEEKKKEEATETDKVVKEEDLAAKYLNLDEEEKQQEEKTEREEGKEGPSPKAGSSKASGKKSALDSLSSFVYGQPMTSEHPLDSLQKLLTKTSIPKVMSTAAGPFPHFNPHHYPYLTEQMMERMCFTPPELPTSSSSSTMPLNLSLKPGAGGSSSDEEDPASYHQDCDSPSILPDQDDGNHSSPGAIGPDGELTEFKCAACSRRFASKGSYRYHLSRCHLSSVKKYGIKEAFNMSPYVYLPLDHTAKFTKYYQMAQELASKGK